VDTESVEAFVGKRVHEVIERLNRFVVRGLVPSLAKVMARFRTDWAERFDASRVRIVRTENSAEVYREMGERCLSNHYRRHYPFDRDETLGIEERVAFSLDGEHRYRMQGFVDRIARAPDGAVEIHDYKTGRWVPSQETLDGDRQLALYQLGVTQRHGRDAPVRLVWHYLLRDQVRVSTRTPEQLDSLRTDTIGLIERIEAEREFAPRPSSLCDWCEFNDICPGAAARATQGPRTPSRPPAPRPQAAAALAPRAVEPRPTGGAAAGPGARPAGAVEPGSCPAGQLALFRA